MKKLLNIITIATLFTVSSAFANTKIAIVDLQAVFQKLPQKEAIQKKLKSEFEVRVKELKSLQENMQKIAEKVKKDGALMSPEEQTKLKREMQSLQADYKLKGKAFEEDNRRRQAEERKKLFTIVQKSVQNIAKKEGYDLVLDSSTTAYVKDSLNISNKVIKEVSKVK